jgi:hypothetical protein
VKFAKMESGLAASARSSAVGISAVRKAILSISSHNLEQTRPDPTEST